MAEHTIASTPSSPLPARLSALQTVQLPITVSRIAHLVGWLFVALPLFALLAPWQQFVVGEGTVSAFTPMDREQSVDAPVGGRVTQWHIQEGSRVQAGDSLLEISDIDRNLVTRLQQQRDALAAKVEAMAAQVQSYDEQTRNLIATRDLLITTAEYRLETARQRVRSAQESFMAAQATLTAAETQLVRLKRLTDDGIVSRRDLELAMRDHTIAKRGLNSGEAALQSAKADQQGAETDIERVRADAQSKTDSSVASANKARSELEDSRVSLAKIEVDLARQQSQIVRAPRDGTVFRLFGNPEGKVVKQGDPLLVVIPDTRERSVELWIDGNDVPLVTQGRHVRLQFEGWPAVQFVGWPSVAVGTFGGTVGFIDATDDGKGKFRVMIVPDETQQGWPSTRFLRQGGRARGWILLNEVRLGWEIWRQLNGFPQTVSMQEPTGDEKPRDVARKRLK